MVAKLICALAGALDKLLQYGEPWEVTVILVAPQESQQDQFTWSWADHFPNPRFHPGLKLPHPLALTSVVSVVVWL